MQAIGSFIGKDLSQIVLPITFYEPFTVLMKPAEQMFFNEGFTKAASLKDSPSVERMLHVVASLTQSYFVVPNRIGKPLNPHLGETYELATPSFHYFSEHVSVQPPVSVVNCQGQGYEYQRTLEWQQSFTGKSVKVIDKKQAKVTLTLDESDTQEVYKFSEAPLVVGNLFLGERYCEPQGESHVHCAETGDTAVIKFAKRSWRSREEDENSVEAEIKDSDGKLCYRLSGKYIYGQLYLEDFTTGGTSSNRILFWTAPEKPV